MKKLVNTGKALSNLKLYSKECLPTKLNEYVERRVKVESEYKSIIGRLLPGVMNREIKTTRDWYEVRDDLLNSGKITPVSMDSIILNYCASSLNYELGFNYMKFLEQENIKPTLAALGKFFKLFHLSNAEKTVDENVDSKIYTLYKDLKEKYNVLDSFTCENAICALSITSHWKECLNLLEEIKVSCIPGSTSYNAIIISAFKNDEPKLAWDLLLEMMNNNRTPSSSVFLSYLNKSRLSKSDFLLDVEKLFEYFRLHNITSDVDVAKSILNSYRIYKLNSEKAVINNRGACSICKQTLERLTLTRDNFENIKNQIFKNVIVGSDVFLRSTPDELHNFKELIANMKQYDVVIDGLNVAYSAGTKQSPQIFSSLVKSVVKHFADKNKSVLLLGRTHMKNWSKKNWSYISQNADTFLAQSLSHDDPYLLYCALNSGMNTIVVSRDLMRSHIFKLEDVNLKFLFRYWLMQNLHQVNYVDRQGKVFFKYPLPYARIAQKSNGVWHIPYDEALNNGDKIQNWLCLNS